METNKANSYDVALNDYFKTLENFFRSSSFENNEEVWNSLENLGSLKDLLSTVQNLREIERVVLNGKKRNLSYQFTVGVLRGALNFILVDSFVEEVKKPIVAEIECLLIRCVERLLPNIKYDILCTIDKDIKADLYDLQIELEKHRHSN